MTTDKMIVKVGPRNCARCGLRLHSQVQEVFSRSTGHKLILRICPQRLSVETESAEAVLHDYVAERQDGTWEISVG